MDSDLLQHLPSFLLGFLDRPRGISNARASRISGKGANHKTSIVKRKSQRTSRASPDKKRRNTDNLVSITQGGVTYLHPSAKNMKVCHIFYLLSPSQMINISVALRGEVAKVSTKDEVVAMRAIKIDTHTRWVAFSITHQIKGPETALEIMNWNQHKIEFNLSENLANVFRSATRDDTYSFQNRTNSVAVLESEDIRFEELTIVSKAKDSKEEESFPVARNSKQSENKEQISTKLQAVPSPSHTESVKAKIFDSIPIRHGSTASFHKADGSVNEEVGEETKKKRKKKKNKKGQQQKSSKKKPLLTITGTKLLYDKRTWVDGYLHATKHVQMVTIWLTTTNIISEELRNELIPFGIYIKKLIDFPNVDHMSSTKDMLIKYGLGDIIKNVVITPKAMEHHSNKIEIEDVKLFFLGTVPLLKIIENLQMHKLVIEIYGPKKDEPKETKALCSWNDLEMIAKRTVHQPPIMNALQKKKKSKKPPKTKKGKQKPGKSSRPALSDLPDLSKFDLLGYAEVNCSALAADGFRLNVDTNISQFNSSEEVTTKQALKHFDLYNVHEDVNQERKGVIENGVFTAKKSHLQVNLQISGLPSSSSIERMELYVNLYKRILIIFREKIIIVPILKRILKLNGDVLGYKYEDVPWVPYWYARKLDLEAGRFSTEEHPCILSGFAIEFSDMSMMMVEGLNDYTFPEAMKDVFFLPTRYGRVLYDDQLIFTKRLYQDFFPIGGIYTTVSKTSIDDIMHNRKTFLRGNIPIPAMRALFMIHKLLQCSTIQLASMEKLFPRPQDLISFNIEFGSPPISQKDQ